MIILEYLKEFKEVSKNDKRVLSTNQLIQTFFRYIEINYQEHYEDLKQEFKNEYLPYNKRIRLLKEAGFNKSYNYCDCNGGSWNLWT